MRKEIRELFDYGVDIVIAFALFYFIFTVFEINLFISFVLGLILFYSIGRSFFIKYIALTVILNLMMCISILSGTFLIRATKAELIYRNIGIVIFLIVFITIQTFVIIYRSFNYTPQTRTSSDKFIMKLLDVFVFYLDRCFHLAYTLVAIFYPIILTCIVILMFSGLYNSVNYFYDEYEDSELNKNLGIISTDTNSRLEYTKYISDDSIFYNYGKMNESGLVYFSSITYFTIGYGDIVPRGTHARNVVIVETIVSNMLNILFFAIYSTLFYEHFIKRFINRNRRIYTQR